MNMYIDKITNIQELCYELYKIDWLNRISTERKLDAMKNWYQETDSEDREDYTLEDFLNEFGFDGELYVGRYEFLDNEYQNKGYIRELLNNEELYQEYLKDIGEN